MIIPVNITFEQWAEAMVRELGASIIPIKTTNWRDWVSELYLAISQNYPSLPDPYLYDEWFEWAEDFNVVVL